MKNDLLASGKLPIKSKVQGLKGSSLGEIAAIMGK
jgi:hypothetical protein